MTSCNVIARRRDGAAEPELVGAAAAAAAAVEDEVGTASIVEVVVVVVAAGGAGGKAGDDSKRRVPVMVILPGTVVPLHKEKHHTHHINSSWHAMALTSVPSAVAAQMVCPTAAADLALSTNYQSPVQGLQQVPELAPTGDRQLLLDAGRRQTPVWQTC